MAVIVDILLNDQTLDLNSVGLIGRIEAALVSRGRNPIVADERICQDEYLAGIRRIGQRLDVAGHRCIEDHFPAYGARSPETRSLEDESAVQRDDCVVSQGCVPRRWRWQTPDA